MSERSLLHGSRRARFLTTLFAILVLMCCIGAFVQVLSVSWSPFTSGSDERGRFSTLVSHEQLVHDAVSSVSKSPSPTVRLSPVTTSEIAHYNRRKERLEARKRAEEAGRSPGAVAKFFKNVGKKMTSVSIVEEGLVEPPVEVAEPLGIRTLYQQFNEEALLERQRYMDIVYTWVNGSEYNHLFRKYYRRNPIRKHFIPLDGPAPTPSAAQIQAALRQAGGIPLKPPSEADAHHPAASAGSTNGTTNRPQRWVPFETTNAMASLADVTGFLDGNRYRFINSRDRESDELRYSFRSLDMYVDWHHGRIIVVSPGHCPLWLDHATNFFARSRRPLGHVRRRVVAVHQDAVLPANQRLTFNTNTIEQHIYKLRNLSSLFVQFNDDYFVNHQTTVSDFVNPHGGAILLHEGGEVRGAGLAYKSIRKIWLGGVYHSNSFNIRELEEVPARYVPRYVAEKVRRRMRNGAAAGRTTDEGQEGAAVAVPQTHFTAAVSRRLMEAHPMNQRFKIGGRALPRVQDSTGKELKEQRPKRKRYFLKHAPFVYCKRMFEHLAERYEREFSAPAVANPHRNKEDLLMPFIHNAFIMDRPWAGSPKYLPQLISVADNMTSPRYDASQPVTPVTIHLDNEDGCAPALNRIGEAARSLLVIFIDDTKENENRIERLADVNPVFFALNDGFSRAESALQLKRFMASKYPERSIFEDPDSATGLEDDATAGEAGGEGAPNTGPSKSKDARRAADDGTTANSNDVGRSATETTSSAAQKIDESFEALMRLPVVVLLSPGDDHLACPLSRSLRLAMPEHRGQLIIAQVTSAAATPASSIELQTGLAATRATPVVPLREAGDATPDVVPRLVTTCVWSTGRTRVVEVEHGKEAHGDDVNEVDALVSLALERAARSAPLDSVNLTNSGATAGADRSGSAVAAVAPVKLSRNVVDLLPDHYGEQQHIRGFVLDMRRDLIHGPFQYHTFGQTLALEDFTLLAATSAPLVSSGVAAAAGDDGGAGNGAPAVAMEKDALRWLYLSPSAHRQSHARAHERTLTHVGPELSAFSVNWIIGLSATVLLHTYPVPYDRYEDGSRVRYLYGNDASWVA